MNIQTVNFLHILQSILHGGEPSLSSPDWEQIFKMANLHNLLPAVYEAVSPLPSFAEAPGQVKKSFLEGAVGQSGGQFLRTEEFLSLSDTLRAEGLTPLVLKGLVCRFLYREPDLRPSGDEDLLIRKEELPRYDAILRREGYRPDLEGEAGHLEEVQELTYESPTLTLEIHVNPFGVDTEARRRMNDLFRDPFPRSVTLDIGGHAIRTLCPTDHYLFLFCHLYKHFLAGGVGIRHLMDLLLFRQTCEKDIDFPTVIRGIRTVGGEIFYSAVLEIGRRYLGFSSIPASRKAPDVQPLLEDILESGCFGNSTRVQRLGAAYITADIQSEEKRRFRLLPLLFPPARQLYHSYPVLLDHPGVLPAVWCVRIGRLLKETALTDHGLLLKSLRHGKKRARILRRYRMTPEDKSLRRH